MTFGPQAPVGCHEVTEIVPSGLAPVSSLARWIDSEGDPILAADVTLPSDEAGARLMFCAEVGRDRSAHLGYLARVVTPGTYAWEPAIVESRSQEGRAAFTTTSQLVIR